MAFALEYRRSAERELEALPREMRSRIDGRIAEMGSDPYPRGTLKLKGNRGDWRIRVGDYCVLNEVDSPGRRVIITAIRHRREVYREG